MRQEVAATPSHMNSTRSRGSGHVSSQREQLNVNRSVPLETALEVFSSLDHALTALSENVRSARELLLRSAAAQGTEGNGKAMGFEQRERYLTIREAAKYMNVSIETIRRAYRSGNLRVGHLGSRNIRISTSALEEWWRNGCKTQYEAS